MKILHICSSYFSTPLYCRLFDHLRSIDVSNIVYVPRSKEGVEDVKNGIFVIDKKMSKLSKLLYWGEQDYITKDIEKRIDVSLINIIHVHRILYGGEVALQLKRKYGIPYIVAIRNSDLYGFGRNISIYKKHCLEVFQNASKIIFISNAYKNIVLSKYPNKLVELYLKKKCVVIPNGIDDLFINNICRTSRENIREGKQIKIVTIGNFDKNKNLPTTIKSIELLQKRGINVCLIVAGKLIDKRLPKLVDGNSSISYIGSLDKKEVLGVLKDSDIFILPSVHETFGLVYAEAMSQGCPVIYTRGQGFDGQYEEGEVGYSVDCFNAKEIAERIVDIVSNYHQISNNCIKNSTRYSWDSIALKYKELYSSCLFTHTPNNNFIK